MNVIKTVLKGTWCVNTRFKIWNCIVILIYVQDFVVLVLSKYETFHLQIVETPAVEQLSTKAIIIIFPCFFVCYVYSQILNE